MARIKDDHDLFLLPWESVPYAVARDRPSIHDNAQERETLLVDKSGRPLIVKEPRPVGFRKPEPGR